MIHYLFIFYNKNVTRYDVAWDLEAWLVRLVELCAAVYRVVRCKLIGKKHFLLVCFSGLRYNPAPQAGKPRKTVLPCLGESMGKGYFGLTIIRFLQIRYISIRVVGDIW